MWPVLKIMILAFLFSISSGCFGEKEITPPAVEVRFYALLDSLSETPPGASLSRLNCFLRNHNNYQIADTVKTEIDRIRNLAKGKYHVARELARQGEFDLAEQMLKDLALHFPGSSDGESARDYLKFEFYFGKAKWLMVRQQFKECEKVARSLLDRDLTVSQTNQVEMILDNVGYVDAALSISERTEAQSACRQLAVMLAQAYIEEGQYPSQLSIADVKQLGAHNSEFIFRGLSAIEEYKSSPHSFSFIGVSSQGRHRIRVVDGQIQQ